MNRVILFTFCSILLCCSAHAQWGNLINNIKSSPLLTQQQPINDIIGKIQSISSIFAQLPLNSGKLEFIKAALPLLEQAKSLSGNALKMIGQGKPVDTPQLTQVSGLLDQVKALIAGKLSTNPLTPSQIPDANNQVQKFSGVLSGILQNEGDSLKKLAGLPK